jgi:hypothetical protein
VRPALELGFERWGKSLWMEQDGIQLFACHDRVPPERSRERSEYPVKVAPSEARSLISNG